MKSSATAGLCAAYTVAEQTISALENMNMSATVMPQYASRIATQVLDQCKQWEEALSDWYKLTSIQLTAVGIDAKLLIAVICVILVLLVQIFSCWRGTKHLHNSLVRSGTNSRDQDIAAQEHLSWKTVYDLAKTAYEPGHTESVIRLVEQHSFDVNKTIPSNGLSLFLCSCLSGKRELVSYMLHKGADVQLTTRTGDSPLYLATFGILNSFKQDIFVLTDLVSAGCNVNYQNYKGYTPLHRAASKGDVNVIKCLLRHGADPTICSKSGIYPIDSAINSGHHEAAELLKIDVVNPHVWDVIDPHTPPRIQLGLQSPVRKHLMESSRPKTFSKVLQ